MNTPLLDTKTLNRAKNMAKAFIQYDIRINEMIESKQVGFDVGQDDDGTWAIQTAYCQIGGCITDSFEFETKEEAYKCAAKMTYLGKKPRYDGLCYECRQEMYKQQI